MWQKYSGEILSITLSLSAPRWIWWGKGSFFNYIDKNVAHLSFSRLTLIGMRKGTFLPLSFLECILSAEFLSDISKLFWRCKNWHQSGKFDTLPSSLSLIKMPQFDTKECKDEHFSRFHSWGMRVEEFLVEPMRLATEQIFNLIFRSFGQFFDVSNHFYIRCQTNCFIYWILVSLWPKGKNLFSGLSS